MKWFEPGFDDPLADPGLPCARRSRDHLCHIPLGVAALGAGAISGITGLIGAGESSSALSSAAKRAQDLQATEALWQARMMGPYLGVGQGALASLAQRYGFNYPGYNENGVVIPSFGPTGGGYQPGGGAPTGTAGTGGGVAGGGGGGDIYFQGTGIPNALAPSSWATSTTAPSGYVSNLDTALKNFRGSPDYSFLLGEGNRAVAQNEAAMGTYGSPTATRDAIKYSQGLASTDYQQFFNNLLNSHNTATTDYQNYFSNAYNLNNAAQQNYSNYFNRLASLSGIGQSAAGTLGNLSTTAAGQIGNDIMLGGQAQAAGYVGGANAISGGLNSALLYSALGNRGNSAYGAGASQNTPVLNWIGNQLGFGGGGGTAGWGSDPTVSNGVS